VLFAITLHEAAHGWVAYRLGDPTAFKLGRISANPLRHIDPFSTIILPIMLIFTLGIAIGAAKPVPVEPRNFKQPLLDMALVALAGPVANFVMACGWALMMLVASFVVGQGELALFLALMGSAGIKINMILLVINMLPIPPLDGGRVITGIMPQRMALKFIRIERYGFWLVIGLFLLEFYSEIKILSKILLPMVNFFSSIIASFFHIKVML